MENENDEIAKKIFSLDQSPPPVSWSVEDVWEDIESKQRNPFRNSKRLIFSIAASVAMLLFALGIFWESPSETITTTSVTEYLVITENDSEELFEIESSAAAFILASCESLKTLCSSPEFTELNEELESLEIELKAINEMISKYGQDPVFIKSKIQIENLKSEITNQLIQIVMS